MSFGYSERILVPHKQMKFTFEFQMLLRSDMSKCGILVLICSFKPIFNHFLWFKSYVVWNYLHLKTDIKPISSR